MTTKHSMTMAAFLAAILAWGLGAGRAGEAGFTKLFNGKDLAGWKTFTKDGKGDANQMITVQDGEIQVSGTPYGYFYSDKSFSTYVLRYSWTYPKNQPEKTT